MCLLPQKVQELLDALQKVKSPPEEVDPCLELFLCPMLYNQRTTAGTDLLALTFFRIHGGLRNPLGTAQIVSFWDVIDA